MDVPEAPAQAQQAPTNSDGISANSENIAAINSGLPPLDLSQKPTSYFEFWPAWVFYLPVAAYWLLLSLRYRNFGLPMAVNPHIPLGGMVGESKFEILQQAGDHARQYILPYALRKAPSDDVLHKCDDSLAAHLDNDCQAMEEAGISFPCVVKPEFGCRGAGVQVLQGTADLRAYLHRFPTDRRYILQQLAPYAAEAGVFYERMPGAEYGRATSITLKYRPVVVGDGRRNLKSLILRDPRAALLQKLYLQKNASRLSYVPRKGEQLTLAFAGSHCRGSIFRNGNEYITSSLSEKIDAIMRDFPSFHYGRLDIKFENIASLQAGKNFCIIEVNGVSSEKTHIWDSRTTLTEAFATLFEQYRTLFTMGYEICASGVKAPSVRDLIVTWWRELKSSRRYPATD